MKSITEWENFSRVAFRHLEHHPIKMMRLNMPPKEKGHSDVHIVFNICLGYIFYRLIFFIKRIRPKPLGCKGMLCGEELENRKIAKK